VYYGSAVEGATTAETNQAQQIFVAVAGESATGSEALTKALIINTSVSESVGVAVENSIAASIFYAQLIASATITSTSTSRFLWEIIDDNEDANWQNINDGQTTVWAAIPDTQTPSWVDVQTV
jgi:hypothetical protein